MISVQTIIVAAIGGAVGTFLATWLRIRHERKEAFRSRLIEAADDLATGILQAIIGLSATYKTIMDNSFLDPRDTTRLTYRSSSGEIPEVITTAIGRAQELGAEAHARQARVALLIRPRLPD